MQITGVAWLQSWLEQLLLRRAPQDDRLSRSVLGLALAAYLLIDLLQSLSSSVFTVGVAMSLVDTVLLMLFVWLVLSVAGKGVRLVQTLTALAGTGALLGLIGLPLVQQAAQAHSIEAGPSSAMVLAWLALLAWSIAVQAHIFRHALSTRYGVGLLLAGAHTILAIAILESLFPRVIEGS
jgi:hypothetical protein